MDSKLFVSKVVLVFLTALFVNSLSVPKIAIAQDVEGYSDPPPYEAEYEKYEAALVLGESVWRKDVNSGCSFSDHNINLDIDVAPSTIKDPKITLTAWDVDYNNTSGCSGGPEVDYLYVNGTFIGQLTGANGTWSSNSFDLSQSNLVEGTNLIRIETDAPGTGCWCVGIGYVEIKGKTDFQVIEYTPKNGQKNVKWDAPDITVEFGAEVKASTANINTIILDYRDQSGAWVKVNTTVTMVSSTKANVTPAGDLKDGIRYRMRVLGGAAGVLDKDDNELIQSTEWFFWTMVNLDGQTTDLYKPNKNKDKMQITWFNSVRGDKDNNLALVPKKLLYNRAYFLWDPKDDVYDDDEVIEFNADVTLERNGEPRDWKNYPIKRPDKYSKSEKKFVLNTVNFRFSTTIAGNQAQATFKLKIEPRPQPGTPKVFEATATANVKNKSPKIKFDAWACEMSKWYDDGVANTSWNGVIAAELTSAKKELKKGCNFTWTTFPIVGCSSSYKGKIVTGAGGFNMGFSEKKNSAWWDDDVWFMTTTSGEIEEIRHVAKVLKGKKPRDHKFIVGLVPSDALPGATGVAIGEVLLLSESAFNAGTVAHEIGHFYGISQPVGANCTAKHTNDPRDIEGLDVHKLNNKSFVEGNSEIDKFALKGCSASGCNGAPVTVDTPVAPLMNKCAQDTNRRWIKPANYEHLLTVLTAAVAVAAASSVSSGASTGDYMVVIGHTDASGNVVVNPLYNTTIRHLDAPSGTGYTAELFTGENGGGTSLGSYTFGNDNMLIHKSDGTIVEKDSQIFGFTIPFDDTAQSLVVKGSNTVVINKSDNGPSAPTASFTNPTEGDTISGTINVTWTGSDDGGTVYYRLEYSPDNGTTWIPITSQMEDTTSYVLDTTSLSGVSKLSLIAYDGFNTTRKEINVTLNNLVTVNTTSPLSGATDVSEGQVVTVYFVNEMDETTITNTTFQLLQGSTTVAGQVRYNSIANSAMFTPTNNLESSTTYTARLVSGASGIKDVNGNALSANYDWTFTTSTTQANPQVQIVSPERGESDIIINTLIQATFDNPANSTTVDTNSFVVMHENNTAIGGIVSYNSTTNSALFTPDADLDSNTTYTATLTTAITDSQGLPLESDYSWSFTTGTEQSNGIRITKVSSDTGVDADGDGLYEKLILKVKVETRSTGTHNLNAQLKDKNGEIIEWTSVSKYLSPAGVYFMDLEFAGSDIASHGIDGPYELNSIYLYKSTSVYHSFDETYQTYPYQASEFFTLIRLSGIPYIAVAQDSTNDDMLNLESYAAHSQFSVSDLTYTIPTNSDTDAGCSIDANNNLDVNPASGYSGFSDLLIEAKDQNSVKAQDSIRVSILKSYKFAVAGWYLISITSQPANTDIASVLAPVSGKYDLVWSFVNGVWKLYDPLNPGFSDLSTLGAGQGFWIRITQAAALTTLGSPVKSQTINLVKNWNMAGLSSTDTLLISDAMASISGRYLSVWAFIDGVWKFYDPNNLGSSTLTNMEPGYGYWINAIMDTAWTLP